MRLFRTCFSRRSSPFKKVAIIVVAIFITCWISVLLMQNSADSSISLPDVNKQLGEKLSFMSVNNHGRVPKQDEMEFLKKNRTLKQPEALHQDLNLKGKNTPRILLNARIPGQSLLSTGRLSDTNKTNKTVSKTNPAPFEVLAKLDSLPSLNGPDSLEILRNKLLDLNQNERILNADKFPPLSNDGLVLIVQTHKRVGYLRQLFDSLRAARDIDKVLLVVSHDYYYEEMNELVQSLDFCRVLQIFYPFSLQVFPDVFPGQSKNDCPRDAKKDQAIEMNCTNALHPDSYGHYREATVTAIKHHWWWKVNTVFDHLRATANYNGYVLFLEEDHYVSPDFVYVTKKLVDLKTTQCPDCDLINLGTYSKSNFAATGKQASTSYWNAGKNNMGFGMDRATWNTLKGCSEKFCEYDDYNWDWSLNSLGASCLRRKLKVLVMRSPRVLHIGTCGIHHHKSCNEPEQARVARDKFSHESAHLFPDSLQLLAGTSSTGVRLLKNYGGWGDIRDHALCLSFVKSRQTDT